MKKIDTSKLKKGDIILSTSTEGTSRLIRAVTRSDISHAMLYVANGSVMDSTSEGVQARNIEKMFYEDECALYVFRPTMILSKEKIDRVVEYVRSETGAPYTRKEAISSVLSPVSRGGEDQFCSRLVARAFASVGLKISDNPDFATPADIQKSPVLTQIHDVILDVSDEELNSVGKHGDTTIQMREKIRALLKDLRKISPAIRVLNDVEPFLLENPEYDRRFAKAYKRSGYLTHWKIEMERFPWRYDSEKIESFYNSMDDHGKAVVLDYCRETIRHHGEGDFRHWETNAAQLKRLVDVRPLETFRLNLGLYSILCENHRLRVASARVLLHLYGH